MGKSNKAVLTREEYEQRVNKHLTAIRNLSKRFNHESRHVSMAIIGNYQWALTYAGEDADHDVKVSDFITKIEKDDICDPYFESKPIYDGGSDERE